MTQKKWARLILFLCFIGRFSMVSGQDTTNTIGNVSLASPTAASLGKYGDIPVSYHTGIPEISIPIYTVHSGSLQLPITLSYHASGLKVQENASWVGAGWALNAGGMITRTVVGAPDDRGFASYNNVTNGHYSDFGYSSYLFFYNGPEQCNDEPSDYYKADDQGFRLGYKDGEPDIYFFNFGNYSGKFYFNDDRTPIIVPEQDFKIQPSFRLGPGFQGFIITTPDGVKYFFGKTGNNYANDPIEVTIPATVQTGQSYANEAASSWFLNKIQSADGIDSITLNYQKEDYSYYTLSMYPVLSSLYNPNDVINCGFKPVKNFISGVRLSQIVFPNGTVSFTKTSAPRTDLTAGYLTNSGFADAANTNSYGLGSISISNNAGFCKKDSFYYGYFYDANPSVFNSGTYNTYNIHSDQYRLRLDSLKELSCDAALNVPAYKFNYFTEAVPRRLSFGVDHWGFSNGVLTNSKMVPGYTVTSGNSISNVPGDNRDPSFPAMRGGSLQKISYPTGGYTQFDYEAHDTYVNYNTYTKTPRASISVGYDGSTQSTGSFTTGATSDTWEIDMTSNSTTGNDNLQFSCGGNYNITGTTPQTYYFTQPANTTCNMTFYGSGNLTGKGATANLYENVAAAVQGNVMVGGLRIKTITNNDGLTPNNIITNYGYTIGGIAGAQTSGILYSRPTYVQIIRNDVWGLVWGPYCSNGGCASCDGTGSHIYYISPASILPMASTQGSHIGYNEVTVSQTGNGHSVYRYYGSSIWNNVINDVCIRTLIQSNSCDPAIPNFPAPPQPFEYMRDQLKYEGYFNQKGQILKDAYYFPKFVNDPLLTPGYISVDIPGMYSFTEYSIQSASKVKDSVISTMYDPINSNAITSTNVTYYSSSYHHQPTRKISITSTGDSLATNIKYAADFRISICDSYFDSTNYYNSTVHTDSVNKSNYLGTCSPQTDDCTNCRYQGFQQFRRNITLARVQYMNWRRRTYANDTANLQSGCYLNAMTNADTLLKPVLRLQTMYENVPIETSNWKNTNLLHAGFTRYDTSLIPVGFAYPGRTKLINLQLPSSSFTNSSVSGSTIARDSRYVDESVYSFNKGNPTQVIPYSGVATSYVWDYLNTEPIAKATNATADQIAYTSFEADGKGGWTYSGTAATDPTAPTGGKSYSLPGGAVSRSALTSGNTYVVSYWSSTGAAYTVTGSAAVKQGKTINGWTYFEHTVTGTTSVSVSGSGKIDELRLYPATAQMTTYAYTPLLGMTANCDVNNKITYYFYDGLGRLKWIKDQDLNIIKTIQYHYQTVTGFQY